MRYSITLSHRADKDIDNLPLPVAERIFDKLESLTENPYRTAEHCEGYPYYHQRIGSYRAILKNQKVFFYLYKMQNEII